MVMQLGDADLDKHMDRARPWLQEVWRVLCDVTRGLEYLHALPALHRDLKPKNIVVGLAQGSIRAGSAKVTDVGTAKMGEWGGVG
jgi:serine/threonine protein kinase